MTTSLSRRGLFSILAGAIAAPYVARAGVLMPVRSIVEPSFKDIVCETLAHYDFDTVTEVSAIRTTSGQILTRQAFEEMVSAIYNHRQATEAQPKYIAYSGVGTALERRLWLNSPERPLKHLIRRRA